jgi:lysozyme family protein
MQPPTTPSLPTVWLLNGTSFDTCVRITLEIEGGYSNNPNDPGKETNFGISKAAFPNLDIKNLTVEDARKIYYSSFWAPAKCSTLATKIALPIFDFAVTSGVSRSVKYLQLLVGTVPDGDLGSDTLTKIGYYAPSKIANEHLKLRARYYIGLVRQKPSQLEFLEGWVNRILRISYESATMLGNVR